MSGCEPVLVLDVGNTSTNWAVFTGGAIRESGAIPTHVIVEESKLPLPYIYQVDMLAVASVVPKVDLIILDQIDKLNKLKPYFLTYATVPFLRIEYYRPSEVGADRLANAIAAAKVFGTPAVVVDIGTAITFDIVSEGPTFIGGIIAPGPFIMLEALHQKTALLPKVDLRPISFAIGRSTQEAINIGIIKGTAHMINGLLNDILVHTGWNSCHLIFTGGYAELIVDKITKPYTLCKNLTLEGIYIAWKSWMESYGSNLLST